MDWLRRLLIVVGLKIASFGGWRPCVKPHLPEDEMVEFVRKVCADADAKLPQYTGEQRRREVQRMLFNIWPDQPPRRIDLLISLARNSASSEVAP